VTRREFVTLLGNAVVAWPLAARAQQAGKLPTIGYLGSATPATQGQWVAAFVQRLRELGWIEGRTIAIEYRWAEGRTERAVTGLSNQVPDLAGKRLELLREIVPGLGRLAILANVGNPVVVLDMREVQATARTLGLEVITLEIRRGEDIVPAFEALNGHEEALYVVFDALVNTHRIRINTLALAARLPTMHMFREGVEVGGLMSYGANFPDMYRRAADYVDKILRGTKPADIPVEQPTKFDLIINITTAKALGLEIPPTLLARADEVIE
jgi:putative ABC transport system substrate-binding protein